MKQEITNILSRFDDAANDAYGLIKKIVIAKGGLIDTQNIDNSKDDMWGVFFDEDLEINREVKIKAIAYDEKTKAVKVFVCYADTQEIDYSEEELKKSLKKDSETRGFFADDAFWTYLHGGLIWTLPTLQSILEGLENYVD